MERAPLFLYLILQNVVSLTVSQPDFINYRYISESGNYSTNSTYQTNLKILLSSLSSRTARHGFYNSSIGKNRDRVYAIVLCRGDVELDTCRCCITDSIIKLPPLYPNYKGAMGWYDYCMLRYLNKSINGIKETYPNFIMWNLGNASNVNEFNQVLRSLFDDLRSRAVSGGAHIKFATGNTPGPDLGTIYGLMQCTPDLSEMDCNNCLLWAIEQIPQYFGGETGGSILTPSCNLRYQTYRFFTEIPADAPPATSGPQPSPPPARTFAPPLPSTNVTTKQGKKDNTTRTIIIVVLTIIPVIGFIVCICMFLKKRKQKKKRRQNAEVSGAGDQISIVELSQYDFESISVATDNFSDSNKLAQGGFGAVYKGRLNGQEIAVKRLDKESLQGDIEFMNEVRLLAKLQHKNLVRLLGSCSERTERLLIYEFVPQSSLDNFILNFGTARLFVVDKTQSTINIAGTRHGKLGGKEHIQMSALRLNSGFMPKMIRCIHIGLLCVQENVAKRPPMASVVLMLSSSSISLEVPSEPGFFLHSGSNNAELPLLQEHRFEFAVSGHLTNEVSTTELYPR